MNNLFRSFLVAMWSTAVSIGLRTPTPTIVILSVLLIGVYSDNSFPEVCARSGCVVGVSQDTTAGNNGRQYEAFLGLPYARPPTNRYRWQNPRPLPSWGSTTWNGTYSRSECVQINRLRGSVDVTGDEDCLFLNIYRPKSRKATPLPVVVFFHGGSFMYGNATLGPEYFMRADIILVSVQYRLGILGFLSTGDEHCPGNFGLKDQVQSLRWVRRNIASFGGDPKSITVMGHEAGAASVHLLMMSPLAADLFHRMIALSGTGIADWAIEVNPLKMFKKQIAYSGILPSLSSNNRMAVRELRRYDAKKLYMDSHQFSRDNDRMTIFKPTIEAKSNTAFLTENPKIVWRTGSYKQRPMLFSFVPGEGAWIGSLFKSNEIISKGNLPSDLFLGSALELTAENVQKAMSYYLNETGTFSLDDVRSVLQMAGDRYFYHPLYETVHQYLAYGDTAENPLSIMKFDFQGSARVSDVNATIHGDDLSYYFVDRPENAPFAENSLDGKMSSVLIKTIVNFVTTNSIQIWQSYRPCTKDTSTGMCDYQVFQRYSKSEPNRILISVRNDFDLEMIKFWDEIVENNFQ